MIRHFGSKRILGVALGALSLAAPSLAFAQQGPAPHRYADGTGNNMIEQLNSSQLNNNYKGPYYNRGEAPPPFRPVQVQAPPPPPPPICPHRHHHRPHPVPPGPMQPVPPGGPR